MSGFVHLHCHSTWSLLDGALTAEHLPYHAAAAGFEAVVLTDHDSLLGAVRFSKACKAAGIKPLFGAELTLDDGSHVTVIAKSKQGYGNLCRLISEAHLANERGKPHTTFAKIAERSGGLFVLSGCRNGRVAQLAGAGAIPRATAIARAWREAIGDDYRIEVFDHRGYGHKTLRDRLLYVSKDAGVPAVVTNDVHYASPRGAATHELLHAIKDIVPLSRTQSLRSTSEYFLKDPGEMCDLFWDAPEAIDETLRIADACDFDVDLGAPHFPEVPIPKGATHTGHLAFRCYEGARKRYGSISRAVEDRIQHELGLIFRMGFASFFLLVADIVDHIRKLGIRCACRGSAAGSLVCYVLGISDVDPVRYDLLFERFMNERREEFPDIDVDVESHRREEVLSYILDTYGRDQTAVCCMVDTFRARMAIREVGKALGLPPEEIDLVAKAFPRVQASDIPRAIEHLPELRGTNLRAGQLEQLFELCLAIDGFPRHLALHPSGVILSSPDLADRVPMQESFQGFTMLQADKHDVEDLGLVKLDVLGVRMLSSIAHATDEIERVHGDAVDLDALPRDDQETFRLISSSRTIGCFQIESPGQRELLARFQPNRFEDLIVDISLFRPGPVKSDMVSPYLERRHGFEGAIYPHLSLEPILRETHGIIVFHEQLIRAIASVTGCSLADADYIRRHLDTERPSLPDDPDGRPGRSLDGARSGASQDNEVGAWFVARATDNGYTKLQAETLWREVFAFASFGFCKSHAAAFALPTYVSAWLKAHYPAAFLAGVLTHDPGMYPRRLIVSDARHFGIAILPIDVNHSDAVYRVERVLEPAAGGDPSALSSDSPRSLRSLGNSPGGESPSSPDGPGEPVLFPYGRDYRGQMGKERWGIRLALSEVRGISDAEVQSLVEARKKRRFTSLEDLWRRTELPRPVLENLVHVGAVDAIEATRTRRELLWRATELAAEPKPVVGQQLGLALDESTMTSLRDLADYSLLEQVEAELEVAGIDARRHMMELYQPLLAELGVTAGDGLRHIRHDSQVWVAGVKVSTQTPAIRSGQRIIFLTLDDTSGPIDVTVFQRVQPRCARTVFHSWLLLVKGIVRKRGGASLTHDMDSDNVGITVVAQEVFDLAELAADRHAGHSRAAALGRQRRRQAVAGLAPGSEPAAPKLWHSSGGSAGR